MARYIICPRCELNFIDADEREYCEVCEKELAGDTSYVDELEDESGEEMELCPLCGDMYMKVGQKMCEECARKSEYEKDIGEEDADKEDDDTWRSYLDDDDTEDLGIPMDEADFEDEEEEEEEYEESEEEEWEEVSADDYDESLDDDDEDDDDDDF